MARTRFVSVNLTVPARDALQRAAVQYVVIAGRRLSMSDALLAALRVAERHTAELEAALSESADLVDGAS